MIKKLEQLRLKHKISKAELCRLGSISKAQYYNYLKTDNIPYNVVERMINGLGYKIAIVIEV